MFFNTQREMVYRPEGNRQSSPDDSRRETMQSYIVVEASSSPSDFDAVAKASIETKSDYPTYVKKILDIGGNYVNLAVYKVDEGKLADALKAVAARYHKIAARVPGYSYDVTTMLDIAEWSVLKK